MGVFWGVRWLGFCVAVEWEEVDLCGNLHWILDVAGRLQALGEEGRRGVALWVDLKMSASSHCPVSDSLPRRHHHHPHHNRLLRYQWGV